MTGSERPEDPAPPARPALPLGADTTVPRDLPVLAARLARLLELCDDAPVELDARALDRPHLGTVDVLARLALSARRAGGSVRITGASDELRELVALAGLDGVLPADATATQVPDGSASGVQVRRQAEQREEPLRVEEERDARDGAVADLEDLD